MKNIKNWLRYKIINYLGIDILTNLLDKHIDNNYNTFSDITNTIYDLNNTTRRELKKDISHFQQSVNILHNTIENVVHIGTDARETKYNYNNDKSWAVICVEGKLNLVKFVSLDVRNTRDLMQYFKKFEGGRHCIDSPHAELLNSEFFKF